MRALTIKQPWAGAIFERGKDVENRSWATSYRGPLIIHAGARYDNAATVRMGVSSVWDTSAIIGIVELVDCVRTRRGKWADADAWHWVLKNPQVLTRSVPASGRLGLWTPSPSMLRLVKRRL